MVGDVPIPSIGGDEVLVRVARCTACVTPDVHVRHLPAWRSPGMIMGHETAGTVELSGAGVTNVREGDPVLVYLVWACGTCRACRAGRDNACATDGRERLGLPRPARDSDRTEEWPNT